MEMHIKRALVDGALQDIRIQDGRIAEMGQLEGPGDFDAGGCVTVPGLVNCHLHLDKCLLNERAPYQDVTGAEKGAMTRTQKAAFTPEDIIRRAERMIHQAIQAGTLALRTDADVDGIVGLQGVEALLKLREKYRGILEIQVAAFTQEGIFADGRTESLMREAAGMGVDLVAGHTIAAGEGPRAIDFILELAAEHGLEAEFHLDESGERKDYLLAYLTERMAETGMQGRVTSIHLCTLAALEESELEHALQCIADAGLKVVSAPTAISTRALAPVKALLEAGVQVGIGSDNIRDFFNPFGSSDVRQAALLLTYVQRFFTQAQAAQIFRMITDEGAALLGVKDYGLRPGGAANLTIFDGQNPYEVLAGGRAPKLILRGGQPLELV